MSYFVCVYKLGLGLYTAPFHQNPKERRTDDARAQLQAAT